MLSLHDLVKVYPGSVTALQGVTLSIPPGMFGLLGPNGAGKSTLMRILAGLLEPTSGRVELDGVDVTERPELVRERLGYLPQDFGFYAHLSGLAMLEHLLALKGVDGPRGRRALARELLERVNLGSAAERKVKGYSGGMRQRLGIAQAIAGDPRLVIVDEPTAGLDPEERVRFYHVLAELAQERIVVLSTHIVEDVAVLCPRFAVIKGGRVLRVTTPTEARGRIEGAMFEGFVERGELEALSRTQCVTQSMLVEGRTRARVFDPKGQPPPGFALARATLEDFYLALVRGALQVPEAATDAALVGSGAR
ncbi:MAG: ABC transporter ATP-binding protein [Planctomycetes bacterium]|nr:ABC transporter ATP-binding protein [Planctomycetota bacterium]